MLRDTEELYGRHGLQTQCDLVPYGDAVAQGAVPVDLLVARQVAQVGCKPDLIRLQYDFFYYYSFKCSQALPSMNLACLVLR